MTTTHSIQAVRVWDLPTRVFHALLILAVAGLIATGELGDDALRIHFWLGYAVLTLVFFRLIWGVIGGHWSRFSNFMPSPVKLITYVHLLRAHQAPRTVGHNPLGALSVLAMLCALLLQVFTGFMSDDEIANAGPWVSRMPNQWVSLATQYHSEIGKVLLIALICFHVGAVLYYKFIRSEDLISPMLHGDKDLPASTHDSRDTTTSRLFALSILAGCAYAVFRLVTLA